MAPDEQKIAVIEERLRGMDDALRIRTDEIARRLEDLNHAHEEAVRVQHTYVTDEIHNRDMKALDEKRFALTAAAEKRAEALALALATANQANNERFARIESFQAKLLGAFALALVFVPLLSGVILYLLTK